MRRTLTSALLILSLALTAQAGRVQEPKDFDRLDGHGATRKKVDVIEWEGNLEIHVYPKGSLKSLGMKIDKESHTTKNNVMVVEYAFNGIAYTLIRRAMLSIPMPDTFQAFRDETAKDYDKIVVSGKPVAGMKAFALAPPPVQLYPDHHPALGVEEAPGVVPAAVTPPKADRKSASEGAQVQPQSESESSATGTTRRRTKEPSTIDSDGGIKNFAF